jgi:nucleotide-binding universal stress UspA family protein
MTSASAPRRILVPTDFSETSERAETLALALAAKLEAEVHMLHVQELLDDPHLEESYQVELDRLLSHGDQRRQKALEAVDGRAPKVTVQTHLVRGISAAETITEICARLKCDLVVMGTHGRRGLKHLLLGSVAENIVRTAPAQVLTVRGEPQEEAPEISSILVPYDFSEHSMTALRVAALWSRILDARLTMLHVVEPVVYPEFYAVDLMPSSMVERIEERSGEALRNHAKEYLPDMKPKIQVATGYAADTIVATVSSDQHDLVIMGTRGLSALEHLLLGSVAENVVRTCPAPVLTIRNR